jgi:type 1 glutamine amidotransferase
MEEELYLMETYGHFDLLLSTYFKGFERPIAWVKPYGHGRVFYTALGHDQVQTENPNFQRMLINAVRWAKNPDAA